MTRVLMFCFSIMAVLLISFPVRAQESTYPDAQVEMQAQLNAAGDTVGLSQKDPRETAALIINVFFGLVGTLFLILIIIGGAQIIFRTKNVEQIERTQISIVNATIGLAILIAAYAITRFVAFGLLRASGKRVAEMLARFFS